MKTLKLLLLVLFANIFVVNAQIGYQVSLLDSATGEPRANETVSTKVTLTDAEGTTVYSGSQSATSNDFGVISLTVGDAKTFDNMDWSKLPLFIEVSVDGKLVGKSQVLSVPVAEYAKKTGLLNCENICKAQIIHHESDFSSKTYKFNNNFSFSVYRQGWDEVYEYTGEYKIYGNVVLGTYIEEYDGTRTHVIVGHYLPNEGNGVLYIIESNH